ncbi:hypothetical protein F4775DRAFT_584466 [Biscogniauxia sp. FL1348]|nr:hypothetical protein F4775DRAFT_584466 [Biscogniauxia sp. FL1348]
MMSAQLQQPPGSGAATLNNNAASIQPVTPQTSSLPPLRNRAADSKSPFVHAYSDSLVAWQLLDQQAIGRAKTENKLIFLYIGYLASPHCHLARQEAFSNPQISSLLNQSFVPIVVDREEYPHIDSLYMSYNQSLSGNAGWPLNVFLTPDLEPVFSGTYWAAPGADDSATATAEAEGAEKPLDWLTVIKKVKSSWTDEESRVRDEAKRMVNELRQFTGEGTLNHGAGGLLPTSPPPALRESDPIVVDYTSEVHGDVDLDQIEEAYGRITRTFDPVFGGFGQEDKFLTPSKLTLMLRATRFPKVVQDVVGTQDCHYISTMGLHTLRRIVAGAVHDHIGGGFHRYSITRDWSLPSFEKMLIDNALLLGLFLDAWLLSNGSPGDEFADVVTEVGDYITSGTLLSPQGGFYTSEVAHSANRRGERIMRNGAFYLWTRKEFYTAVRDEQEAEVAAAHWDVQEHGNVDHEHDPHDEFLNQNVIRIAKNYARLSNQLGITEREVKRRVESARIKLKSYRERERARPDVDTKIVAAYNGMAIAALSRTAAALLHIGNDVGGRGARYLDAAKKAALFIKKELWDSGNKTLYRMYSNGRSDVKAVSEDYAFLIEGLLELYEVTADESWLEWADELQAVQISLFYDHPTTTPWTTNARCGAFYSTAEDAPYTLFRVKDAMDTSQPSTNSVSVSNLFRLGALLSDCKYTYLAKESVNAFGVEMGEHSYLFPGLLCGIIPWKLGGRHWIAVGESNNGSNREALAAFHTSPRASLFTLRYHDPKASNASSWINRRDPSLCENLRHGAGVFTTQANAGGFRKIEDVQTEIATDPIVIV